MISIGLNLILGVLLSCALVLGLRLERKLRGLRQSHQDFAKAVSELDQAAARTEQSLASLRAGTETAKNEVASRIDRARLACQRLEKLVADADKTIERAAAQPLLQQPLALSQPIDRTAPSLAAAPSAIARPEPEMLRPAAPVQMRPAAEPKAEPARSRAKLLDDDLFAADDPMVGAPPVRAPPVREPPVRELPVREPLLRERPAPEPEPQLREPPVRELQAAAPHLVADNTTRAEREAFYREVLDRGPAPERAHRDPFEADSRFAVERRAMLAAVMGGRR
jgi:hypothetical protein